MRRIQNKAYCKIGVEVEEVTQDVEKFLRVAHVPSHFAENDPRADWDARSVIRPPFVRHEIAQLADTLDRDFHDVSRQHGADALGRAGGDQVAGHEGHGLRDVADDDIQRKDEVARVALLTHFTVNGG